MKPEYSRVWRLRKMRRECHKIVKKINNMDDLESLTTDFIKTVVYNYGFCPYCGSNQLIKGGIRYNKLDYSQLYRCLNCQRRHTKSKVSIAKIERDQIIINLHKRGISSRNICKELKNQFNIKIAHTTVIRSLQRNKEGK